MSNIIDEDVFSLMQEGKPLASYKKVSVGKLNVKMLDPFDYSTQKDVIISGNPFRSEDKEKLIIDLWTPREKVFFEKANRYHIQKGSIIPYDRASEMVTTVENYNALSDDEIRKILSQPFFTLQNALKRMTASSVIVRLLNRARDMEKSEKVINAIQAKLVEVQETENPLLKRKE